MSDDDGPGDGSEDAQDEVGRLSSLHDVRLNTDSDDQIIYKRVLVEHHWVLNEHKKRDHEMLRLDCAVQAGYLLGFEIGRRLDLGGVE